MTKLSIAFALSTLLPFSSLLAAWTLKDEANTEQTGRCVNIKQDDQLRAKLVYGEGQIKPYLVVYGEEGDCLNAWDPKQQYPHHRGIFIGWNKIGSDLGQAANAKPAKADPNAKPEGDKPKAAATYDLWHFNNGGTMTVTKLDKLEGTADAATLVATIEWAGGAADANGSKTLLTETRTLRISRPAAKTTQVDATYSLTAARDLSLDGDLQHAGAHFRASKEVQDRHAETAYVWEPDLPGTGGKVASPDMKWARLIFPIGQRWYTATELNAPGNPTDELSWRDYGRFGFFFKKTLKKGENLTVKYRFLTELIEGAKAKPDVKADATLRTAAQAAYDAYTKEAK